MVMVALLNHATTAEEMEDGHADGEAVLDLIEDGGVGAVGEFAGDFDAAIDRAGMHDEHVGLAFLKARHVQAEEGDVLAHGGEEAALLTFVLNAQEHDDIGVGQDRIEVVRDLHAKFRKDFRHQRGRADQRHARAELGQRPNIRARHAAEEDIAANHDVQVLPRAFVAEPFAHSERVE